MTSTHSIKPTILLISLETILGTNPKTRVTNHVQTANPTQSEPVFRRPPEHGVLSNPSSARQAMWWSGIPVPRLSPAGNRLRPARPSGLRKRIPRLPPRPHPSDHLAVPEITAQPGLPRTAAQHSIDSLELPLTQAAGPSRPLAFQQAGKPVLFKAAHPILHCAGRIPEKPHDVLRQDFGPRGALCSGTNPLDVVWPPIGLTSRRWADTIGFVRCHAHVCGE